MALEPVPSGQSWLPGDSRIGAYPDDRAHVGPPVGMEPHPGVFWFPGYDTPLKSVVISGRNYVVPAFDLYTEATLPQRYKQGDPFDPVTTLQEPTETYRRTEINGRYGSSEGDAPFILGGTHAQEWEENQPAMKAGQYPFDPAKIRDYCEGKADALPNPDTVPYIQPSAQYSAIPIIRAILDASGLKYVVKSGFRPRHLAREMQDVIFRDAETGKVIGNNFHHVRSVDDGHYIDSFNAHMTFSALDIAGPSGTREELDGLLTYLRQFPEFFTEISVGPEYRSNLLVPEGYYKVPWHHQTGELSAGSLIVADTGKGPYRVEKSPREKYGLVQIGSDYAPQYRKGATVPTWFEADECCQSDRIHIATNRDVARGAALEALLSKVGGSPSLAGYGQVDGGNLGAKPQPGASFPPIVSTDIGVRDQMNSTLFGGTSQNYVFGVCEIPQGFQEGPFVGGVAAMVRVASQPGAWETRDRFQIAFHRPSKTAKNMGSGWVKQDAPEEGPTASGVIGAQRRGEWIYCIAGQHYQSGQRRIQWIDRMNTTQQRERRSHDGSIYYEGLGSAAAGATTHSFHMWERNAELFVSDHFRPQLFFLGGFGVGKTTDIDGVPMAYHWQQEDQRFYGSSGTESLPFYPAHRFGYEFWQTWHYLDTGPRNTLRPCFAFPWASDPYDPPEVWFWVPETDETGSHLTGRLKIYRSRFEEGNYDYEHGYVQMSGRYTADDPRLVINGGNIDKQPGELVRNVYSIDEIDRNPDKWAYNPNWFSEENLVGICGPLRNVPLTLNDRNDSVVFKVLRDWKRADTLWAVAAYGNQHFYARSTNDGFTWSRWRATMPIASRPEHDWQAGGAGGTFHAVITESGDIYGPARASHKGQQIQALVHINHAAAGIGGVERERIVFKEGQGGA